MDECRRRDPRPIEVQVIDNGTGKITVTGSLGDVMKESAQLAVWVRVHAGRIRHRPERLKSATALTKADKLKKSQFAKTQEDLLKTSAAPMAVRRVVLTSGENGYGIPGTAGRLNAAVAAENEEAE